jgi:hypothetical protein
MSTKRTFAAKLHSIENGIAGVQNNPEIQELMALYGYTPERLLEEQQQVEEVAQLHSKQLEEAGGAQQSTQERDRAFATGFATLEPSSGWRFMTNRNYRKDWELLRKVDNSSRINNTFI